MVEQSRTIVISGASSGIGRATALRLAHHGWRVFAGVRKDSDAEALETEATGALETLRLDVANPDSITAPARDVQTRLADRGLDGLFNNAASASPVRWSTPPPQSCATSARSTSSVISP